MPALRLTGISHVDPLDVALAEFGYEYDANSNRTRLDVTGTEVVNGYELSTYDELNRLDFVRYPDASEAAFAYDANGNLASITPAGGTAIAYGYDAADQLQEVDSVDLFDYDANGNRISHGADAFTWDWANRLTAADVQGTTSAFTYLGDNTRAAKTIDGTTTTAFLWDRLGGLPLLLDDGTTSAVHASGGVLSEVDNATDDHAWSLLDGLGSVRARSDDLGVTLDTADWDAWGEARNAPEGLFGWTGEQSDPETGLTHLRARYYSPVYARFLSTDAIQPNAPGTQGYNPYAFARNNPLSFTDPSGNSAVGGLTGLGQAIADAFALILRTIECILDGECGNPREHQGREVSDEAGKLPAVKGGVGCRPASPNQPTASCPSHPAPAIHGHPEDGAISDVVLYKKGGIGGGAGGGAGGGSGKSSRLWTPGTYFHGFPSTTLRWAQNSYRSAFGIAEKNPFKGLTVEQVAGKLSSGQLSVVDVPVMVLQWEGVWIIYNTRSSMALMRANIPPSKWYIRDATGISDYEWRLTRNLNRNGLPPTGTTSVPILDDHAYVDNELADDPWEY